MVKKFGDCLPILLLLLLFGVTSNLYAEEATNVRLNQLIQRANTQQPSSGDNTGPPPPPLAPPPPAARIIQAPAPTTGGVPGGAQEERPTPADLGPTAEELSEFELPKPKPLTLRDVAFKELLDKISPLTPEQIIELRKAQDRTQRAVATPPDAPPRPVSSTLTIDLSPGVTPPVIRLGAGFVSSLVFVDSTGQPWPIADYSLGNPKNFHIQWDKKTNTLFMQGKTAYSSGNMAVRLAKLDTPVMISLVSGQREVDYRVDLQVNGRGPNAKTAVGVSQLPGPPNPLLLSVLDGVPPPGSIELEVTGGCGRAWLSKGKMIFRSHLTVLSPAWSGTVSSLDGTRVYEMNPTPLILATQQGKTIKIAIKGL